jgi:hypothetical protein
MKKILFLIIIAGVIAFSSCGSGKKDKSGIDSLASRDTTAKGLLTIKSWDLFKKFSKNFESLGEKNIGKSFKISNLLVQDINKKNKDTVEIECLAYNPSNDSLTGQAGKSTVFKLNGKTLHPGIFGYSLKFILANPKEADTLKKVDNNDMTNETVYTFYNVVTIVGTMTEVGGNFIGFGKCKITSK